MAVRAQAERSRCDQLHSWKLRSAGGQWTDDAAQGRRGNRAWNFSEDISGTYGEHAGGYRAWFREEPPPCRRKRDKGGATIPFFRCINRLLHFRSHADDGAPRSHLGHGIRSVSAGYDREQEGVLRARAAGEMADGIYARSEGTVGIHRAGGVGEDG